VLTYDLLLWFPRVRRQAEKLQFAAKPLTAERVLPIVPAHERPHHDLRHLPGDYSLARTLAAAVYSQPRDHDTPGQRLERFWLEHAWR
jgi:hypothetical protein